MSSQPGQTSVARVERTRRRSTALTRTEGELWHAWKRATDSVMSLIARDITAATGLSGADYGVLSRLVELGRGSLRQQALANSMAWQKSRLSHHLSRMQQRALIRREPTKTNNVLVVITPAGKRALTAALPVHARAVHAHLITKVPRPERASLFALLARLSAD